MNSSLAFSKQKKGSKDKHKEETSYDFGASILIDYDSFDPAYSNNALNSSSETEIRRTRVALKSVHNQYFSSKIQLDYDVEKSEFEFKDAYISYTGFNKMAITLGKQKEPFGLNKNNSLRKLPMIERSIVTQAFAPGRNEGISIERDGNNWFWKAGYYQLDSDKPERNPKATTGRIGWIPFDKKGLTIHFALAASLRDLQGENFKINETLEIHGSDSVIEGKKVKTDSVFLSGSELIIQKNGISFVTENQSARIKDTKNRIRDYDGYYWQFGYRINDEAHKYKMGKFGGFRPKSTLGALELTYRKSLLKLKKEEQNVEISTFGINYYFDKSIKVMLNRNTSVNEDKDDITKGKAYSLRFQYSF